MPNVSRGAYDDARHLWPRRGTHAYRAWPQMPRDGESGCGYAPTLMREKPSTVRPASFSTLPVATLLSRA